MTPRFKALKVVTERQQAVSLQICALVRAAMAVRPVSGRVTAVYAGVIRCLTFCCLDTMVLPFVTDVVTNPVEVLGTRQTCRGSPR